MEFKYEPESWVADPRRSVAARLRHAIYQATATGVVFLLDALAVKSIADSWPPTHPPLTPAQLRSFEPSMSYRAATAHRFRIMVADEVADPEQRNTNLHEVSVLLNDPDRIAAIGSLGPGETDGYDAALRKIAHTLVPVAGW